MSPTSQSRKIKIYTISLFQHAKTSLYPVPIDTIEPFPISQLINVLIRQDPLLSIKRKETKNLKRIINAIKKKQNKFKDFHKNSS
jgi:hypothetical protein